MSSGPSPQLLSQVGLTVRQTGHGPARYAHCAHILHLFPSPLLHSCTSAPLASLHSPLSHPCHLLVSISRRRAPADLFFFTGRTSLCTSAATPVAVPDPQIHDFDSRDLNESQKVGCCTRANFSHAYGTLVILHGDRTGTQTSKGIRADGYYRDPEDYYGGLYTSV